MKLIEKFKNIFTEVVEEEEVKVEQISTKSKKENVPDVVDNFDEVKIEKEEIKKPVFFTDHDFDDLEKKIKPKSDSELPKRETREFKSEKKYGEYKEKMETREEYNLKNYQEKYNVSKRDNYSSLDSNPSIYRGNQTNVYNDPYKEKKEERVFKPTPIISPVYGILDKNYHKEDIVTKRETNFAPVGSTNSVSTIDQVRQKAYGTLEDELENTLFGSNSILFNNKTEENDDNKTEFFDELEVESKPDFKENDKSNLKEDNNEEYEEEFDNSEQDKKIRDLEEITMDIGKELNSLLNKKESMKTQDVKRAEQSSDEDDNEDDLFNLIDTMYEGDE